MSSSTQVSPVVMTVDAAGFAAITQSMLDEGITVNNTTTGVVYLSQRVAGVMTLVPEGGSGAIVSKYWVNVAGQVPATGYTTIQSAINAAVADGHNDANPTTILIYPGTYTENLVTANGVHLNGLQTIAGSQTPGQPAVIVLGAMTCNTAGSTFQRLQLSNIFFRNLSGPAAATVTLTGLTSNYYFNNCNIWQHQVGFAALEGGAANASQVGISCGEVINLGAAGVGIHLSATGFVSLVDCFVDALSAGATAVDAGSIVASQTEFIGQLIFQGGTAFSVLRRCSFTN